MTNGIAKIENGISVAWAAIHDGNKCCSFFAADPIPDPLPEGYVYADTHEASFTAAQLKRLDVEAWYAEAIAAGWVAELRDEFDVVVYAPGYTMRIDDAARNEFDQLATKWTIKIISGANPALATTTIYGIDETSASGNDGGHVVTVDIFLALIDAGGAYYESLLNLRESYLQAIAAGNVSFTIGDPLPEPE